MAVMDDNIVRLVSFYSKGGDFPAGKHRLEGIRVSELQSMFGIAPENPMYDVYPVGPDQARHLQRFVKEAIDLEKYDYFVECYGPRDDASRSTKLG
jgi:hypothetical protein